MQDSEKVAHADDELRARLASNTPRPAIGKHVLIAGAILNDRLFKQLAELQGCTTTIIVDREEVFIIRRFSASEPIRKSGRLCYYGNRAGGDSAGESVEAGE